MNKFSGNQHSLRKLCVAEDTLKCQILTGLANYPKYLFLGKAVETALFLKQTHVLVVGKYQLFNDNIC